MIDLASYREWDASALLVAEAGVNHEGHLEQARRMVREAADAGAGAIKFQTYTAARLATRASRAYWDESQEPTESQFELFSRYDRFGKEEYRAIAEECERADIAFMTSAFDVDSIDWLDDLVAAFKIASGDITNVPLLTRIARTGKPVLLSTGASTLDEIREALVVLDREGSGEVAVLQCTLAYPTPIEDAAVGGLRDLADAFPERVLGYSDHTVPPDSFTVIAAAYALGARVVETHFTLDRSRPGNDHYHSFEPAELARLAADLEQLRALIGPPVKQVLPVEEAARLGARRSVVARTDIVRGTRLVPELLDVKRPGGGVPPMFLMDPDGWKAAVDIPEDSTIEWSMLERDGG
ncbi:MAG TPA: N-acetylneuraminate synthase family protein [Ilumatobacteraceae bacterium]|nr:N-acetylneuraminate synthase family protein [Ilumatobacteraceae bacterium]